MRLTVVGSADAFNAAGRFHSCYLLEAGGAGTIMIDFGATALAALRRIGRDAAELDGLALTHLHGDHVGGYPFLVIDAMYHSVRRRPLEVRGPVGTEARLDQVLRAAYGDLADDPRPYQTRVAEIAPGGQAELAGWSIEGFAAEHMDPPEEPLCLRLTGPGGVVVAFSGDTLMGPGLRAAAAGADLLVAECSGLAPPIGRHCTWLDWQRELPTIGARRVVLSHLGTRVRERVPELLAEAPPGVDLSFADDGMTFEVGA